jgi:hypothetical protein
MFVGHYGVSFAVKSVERRIPLWLLFIAVQAVDVLWAIFILMGIEKVRITPGFTATNPLDLYYMPYTHSLLAALLWSAVGFIAYRGIYKDAKGAGLVGAAIFSHWVLDLIVHSPDLPLYDDTYKIGLGLWNYRAVAFALEAGILFGGIFLYLRTTRALSLAGRVAMPIFGVLLLLVQAIVFFGEPPTSPASTALTALFSYALFAGAASWIEGKRQ